MNSKFYFDGEWSVSLKYGMRERIKEAYRHPSESNQTLRSNFDETCRCISDKDYMNKCSLLDVRNRVVHIVVKRTIPVFELGDGVRTYFLNKNAWSVFDRWVADGMMLPREFEVSNPNIARVWYALEKKVHVTDDIASTLKNIVGPEDVVCYKGAAIDPTYDKDKFEKEFGLGWNWKLVDEPSPINVFNSYSPDFTDYYSMRYGYNGYDWFQVNGVIKNVFDTIKIV